MINTETIERREKKGNRILKKLAMFGVAMLCCLVATASSSWLSSEKVVAVGGVPIIVNKVTIEDINNANQSWRILESGSDKDFSWDSQTKRHGTILRITAEEAERLKDAYPIA